MDKIKIDKLDYTLSRVAFGGVVVADESQSDANKYVAEAIDAGVNYFDVAPTYSNAEERLGPALKTWRKDVFLACKTEDRTRKGSQALLEKSLKNLQTDYFDLYQLHAVYNLQDVEQTFGPNGSFETYLKAKEQGYIKHIGFSAHSTEAALALMEHYDFDSIMFPFNFVSLIKNDYGSFVLKKALEKKMAIIGIKSMALSVKQESDTLLHPKAWYHPIEDFDLASKAVKYTFSRGIDVIVPPGDIDHFRWAVEIMKKIDQPLDKVDLDTLIGYAKNTVPLFPLKAR
ncbi:MAG TPA: oxidoreductase [Clostridiales bacterium]|jgi:aryl-alcohol dehydrogenase-like predicted oxidoreductase|nr:oxidoreductase [Clostridiales bacterium]